MKLTALFAAAIALTAASGVSRQDAAPAPLPHPTMDLGAFSTSLAVADIAASRDFYAKLGFTEAGGNIEQNWLILRNGPTTIGLFQGMFERNIMTFNPGWDDRAQPVKEFTDVRELQRQLEANGVAIVTRAAEEGDGPASFVITDPDGNPILIDQHVDRSAGAE